MVYDLPDRLNQKWDAMNIKRLMGVLLSMKRFDPELLKLRTKPERERLAYEDEKKNAILQNIRCSNNDVAELRARMMPEWDADSDAQRLDMIQQNVECLINSEEIGVNYADTEREAEAAVKFKFTFNHPIFSYTVFLFEQIAEMDIAQYDLTWEQIIERARHRREQLNRLLVGNPHFKRSYLKEDINSTE